MVLVLLVMLSVKSLYLDTRGVHESDQEYFKQIIDNEYTGITYRSGLMTVRILNVKDTSEGVSGHARKYFLWIFPAGDVYFSADKGE